ncbi:MAG TPA: tRNA pseudouridine(55) synthase TruB [Gemmatimonadales bacterium]|nr:tRNA pseudouridine(55) synthase TruB [Gemmatimonadales bacterium]
MLVDKPAGPTSHDVVQRVRRALGTRAVGHTGTLDPFATGLLVVLVGRATRLARFVEAQPKTYLGTARLGLATDTDDRTGTPLGPPVDVAGIAEDRVVAALAALQGEQQQRPPRYSARHVDGERSYRLARRGIAAELPATPVTVHRIELVSYAPPELAFRVTVSAGTYVRALVRDLGARLGVGAHLTALRREAVGALRIEDAVPLERVDASALRPPGAALGHLPTRELDEPGRLAVSHGRALPVEPGASGDVALLHAGRLVAVARADDGWLRPSVVLGTP